MLQDDEHEQWLYSDDNGLNWPSTIIKRPSLTTAEFAALRAITQKSPQELPSTAYFSCIFTQTAAARAKELGAPKYLMPRIRVKIAKCSSAEFRVDYTIFDAIAKLPVTRSFTMDSLSRAVDALNEVVVGTADSRVDYLKHSSRIKELVNGLAGAIGEPKNQGRGY